MYKLVAIDIDGTTVNKEGRLSEKTVKVIREVVEKGVPVCIVTGRNVHNANKIAKKLNTKTPFICADGAVMYDTAEKKVIYEKVFSNEQLKEILFILDKHDIYIEMSSNEHYYQYIKRKELGKYNYGGSPNNAFGKIKRIIKHNVRYIRNLNEFINSKKSVNQIIFIGEPNNILEAKKEIMSKNYDNIELRDNLWENFVFLVLKDCKKSDGVQLLCDHYGCNMSEVIAMGDELNDIDMIEKAGLGIAMENANPRIKEVAKFITLSNDNDGVAHALEKFILNGETL